MPGTRTTITELVTGLGMLGHADAAEALAARPGEMVSVSPAQWDVLGRWSASPLWRQEFAAAFANGRAFLDSQHALRGRRPLVVEWRGSMKAVDDELVPADLRVDHVYLVSCKYLSRILGNASPGRLFDGLLRLRAPSERTSWYEAVAPDELRGLLRQVGWAAPRHVERHGSRSRAWPDRRGSRPRGGSMEPRAPAGRARGEDLPRYAARRRARIRTARLAGA